MDQQKRVNVFEHFCEMYDDTNDTFQLVKKYVNWGQKKFGEKPVPDVDRIDCLIVGKLKEYLIVQLQSLLGVEKTRNKDSTVSLSYLLEDDSDYKKSFIDRHKCIYKIINTLRNKRLAHFDFDANSPKTNGDKEECSMKSKIDEIREWLPNDCIGILMNDIFKCMCWYADKYSLPGPGVFKHSWFEYEIEEWLEKK